MISLGRYGASVRRVALLSRDIKAAAHRTPFVEVGRLKPNYLGRWVEVILAEGWENFAYCPTNSTVRGEMMANSMANSTLEAIKETLGTKSLRSLDLS
eukprot:Selendium_serpulae@DN6465_c5_g1_i1.p1